MHPAKYCPYHLGTVLRLIKYFSFKVDLIQNKLFACLKYYMHKHKPKNKQPDIFQIIRINMS